MYRDGLCRTRICGSFGGHVEVRKRKRVIYDLGAHLGQDLHYYLRSSDLVVAVEANPDLVRILAEDFRDELSTGRLIIISGALSDSLDKEVSFFLHDSSTLFGTLYPEKFDGIYSELKVPAINLMELINTFGYPHYVKIDLEGQDYRIIKQLFDNEIYPDYLSAEFHDPRTFCYLVSCDKYKAFKVVEGCEVGAIFTENSLGIFSNKPTPLYFSTHSSGPFGNDIPGPWMDHLLLWDYVSKKGLGWRDIHASAVDEPLAQTIRMVVQ